MDSASENRLATARPPIPDRVEPTPGVYECVACGACCAAPDISTLGKPLGVPCVHLGPDQLCAIYADRPAVCRNYRPDRVCAEVAPLPTLEARVARYLEIYGLDSCTRAFVQDAGSD